MSVVSQTGSGHYSTRTLGQTCVAHVTGQYNTYSSATLYFASVVQPSQYSLQ